MKENLALLLLLILFSIRASAQSEKLYQTDKVSDKYVYVDVVKTYERVAAKGYKSVDLFQKLGNSYYAKCNLDKAAKWYRELFALTTDLAPEYYYRYAESLRSISLNQEADDLIAKLQQKSKIPVKKKV